MRRAVSWLCPFGSPLKMVNSHAVRSGNETLFQSCHLGHGVSWSGSFGLALARLTLACGTFSARWSASILSLTSPVQSPLVSLLQAARISVGVHPGFLESFWK